MFPWTKFSEPKKITSICWCPPHNHVAFEFTHYKSNILLFVCIVYVDTSIFSLTIWVDSGLVQVRLKCLDLPLWGCWSLPQSIYNSQHYSTTTCSKLLLLLSYSYYYVPKEAINQILSQYRSNNPGSSKKFIRMIYLTSSECVLCGRVTPGITRATALRALLLLPTV
jgi:hypothetical protein